MAKIEDQRPAPKKQGRRPGQSGTREEILNAARSRFASDGYTGATIRKIAGDSGVDASLVMQFFGSKDQLFREVMAITPSALLLISNAFDGPEDALGERVTRAFLDLWDAPPPVSEPFIAMLRAAISNEQAAAQLRELIEARVVHDLTVRAVDSRDMQLRVEMVTSMLIGVVVGRRIIQVDALVSQDHESLVRLIAPAVHSLLTSRA